MSFHLSLITSKYHWVRAKWFLSVWYTWCKPCTYLESRLVLSPNGSKWDSTWASSPRSTIECIQNDYWAYGMFGANRAPQTDRNELPLEPHHLDVSAGASKTITEPMVCLAQTMHLAWVKISTISKRTKTRFHLCLVTSEYHRVRPKWLLSLWYVWHKPSPILHQH
jgi:hypothetical protein